MRIALSELSGRGFDVAVVGAGINGCAAAQELAAAGYAVLLVDKGDYGAGSSSRSTRLVHCGLRYLAPGGSPYAFVRHPSRFATALKMTRKAMQARSEFVTQAPSRARKILLGFPVWRDMPYRPWHIDLALRLVDAAGPGDVPLERKLYDRDALLEVPLFRDLRDQTRLLGVSTFAEYQFDWPERVAMDMVLDARRLGAVCRNYTMVTGMGRRADGSWALRLTDALGEGGESEVVARMVLNTTGVWTDRVNRLASGSARRKILGTKGAHLVLRLRPEYEGHGIISLNREMEEPIYLVPWRGGLHYMGVTETVYEGDLDDVRADPIDVEWLLDELNHLIPSLAVGPSDVLCTWAGVRPLTYDPHLPKGARSREIHDLEKDGLPGVLAITAGPVTTHRSAGRELCAAVAKRIRPSGPRKAPDYHPVPLGEDARSPSLLNHYDGVRLADLRRAAETEDVACLTDLLARRTGLVWTETGAREGAQRAAEEVADVLGWDEGRKEREVQAYLAYLDHAHWRPAS
jgi:glycerol-3-phosphate dehydrogenase